jgi:3'-phosphoadenosine 5'-phosphosulfate (PAPS) 3'-phosphatase
MSLIEEMPVSEIPENHVPLDESKDEGGNVPQGDPAAQDLLSQARRLRQNRSTAEIILEEEPARLSRKAIVYITLSGICLMVLLYLFLAPGPRQTLQNRSGDFAQAMASDRPTTQAATPADTYKPPPEPLPSPEVKEEPVGPYGLPPSATPRTPAAVPSPPPPVRLVRSAAPATPPVTAAPRESRPAPAAAAVKDLPTDARPAYQLLMGQKPDFAALVRGNSPDYRLLDSSAKPRGGGVYVFDFVFQHGASGEQAHFLWEVDPADGTVKPIGLTASKFDRQQLRDR